MARPPERIAAVYDEVDKAHSDYLEAKAAYIDAQVRYESARERFSGLCRLAAEMLPTGAWNQWQDRHPEIRFFGLAIGDSIVKILDAHAFEAAWDFAYGKSKEFRPHLSADEIQTKLEEGGFEFKGATPLREVNGALMKLEGATKEQGRYRAADAKATLEWVQKYTADETAAQEATKNAAAEQADTGNDNVPF